jgi:hypothetical protein
MPEVTPVPTVETALPTPLTVVETVDVTGLFVGIWLPAVHRRADAGHRFTGITQHSIHACGGCAATARSGSSAAVTSQFPFLSPSLSLNLSQIRCCLNRHCSRLCHFHHLSRCYFRSQGYFWLLSEIRHRFHCRQKERTRAVPQQQLR